MLLAYYLHNYSTNSATCSVIRPKALTVAQLLRSLRDEDYPSTRSPSPAESGAGVSPLATVPLSPSSFSAAPPTPAVYADETPAAPALSAGGREGGRDRRGEGGRGREGGTGGREEGGREGGRKGGR